MDLKLRDLRKRAGATELLCLTPLLGRVLLVRQSHIYESALVPAPVFASRGHLAYCGEWCKLDKWHK